MGIDLGKAWAAIKDIANHETRRQTLTDIWRYQSGDVLLMAGLLLALVALMILWAKVRRNAKKAREAHA